MCKTAHLITENCVKKTVFYTRGGPVIPYLGLRITIADHKMFLIDLMYT